jgi:hypothetical protein
MMLSGAKFMALALTLASSVVALPVEARDTNIWIGYRRVHPVCCPSTLLYYAQH